MDSYVELFVCLFAYPIILKVLKMWLLVFGVLNLFEAFSYPMLESMFLLYLLL